MGNGVYYDHFLGGAVSQVRHTGFLGGAILLGGFT